MKQNEVQIIPVDTIKGFGQINIEDGRFQVPKLNGVEGLLSRTYDIMDFSMMKESKLFLTNMGGENRFDSIGNNFGNNIVYDIAKGDRSIFTLSLCLVLLWNESEEG